MKTKCLLYCTKATNKNDYLIKNYLDEYVLVSKYLTNTKLALNGKIVCECEVETEEIEDRVSYFDSWFNEGHHTKNMTNKELEKRSCLSYQDLCKYLGEGEPNEVKGYALHISNIKVFDKPKELEDYAIIKRIADDWHIGYYERFKSVGTAPQNMQYVYDVNSNNPNEKIVLISIRPQWLCKILNGEKTIEVRRKVLKGMVD